MMNAEESTMAIIKAAAKRHVESRCADESRVEMPPRAQRINGRKHYVCWRELGHDGPHRWPLDGSLAEWDHQHANCQEGKS